MISGSGVAGSGHLAVTQTGTPSAFVDVAAGMVWIPGSQGGTAGMLTNAGSQRATYGSPLTATFTDQGSYIGFNDASGGATSVPIAANSSGNPRIDLIVVVVQDAQYSGSNNQVIITVVEGTPASSPSPPTCPNNCVVAAQIAVASGFTSIVTANITDKRPFLQMAKLSSAGTEAANLLTIGITRGVFTFTGNGTTTVAFLIPHGLGATPSSMSFTPFGWQGTSANEAAPDGTNLNVQVVGSAVFTNAAPYFLFWMAML